MFVLIVSEFLFLSSCRFIFCLLCSSLSIIRKFRSACVFYFLIICIAVGRSYMCMLPASWAIYELVAAKIELLWCYLFCGGIPCKIDKAASFLHCTIRHKAQRILTIPLLHLIYLCSSQFMWIHSWCRFFFIYAICNCCLAKMFLTFIVYEQRIEFYDILTEHWTIAFLLCALLLCFTKNLSTAMCWAQHEDYCWRATCNCTEYI